MANTPEVEVPRTRLLLAPCCHDSIDLDPPDTEYMMIKVRMRFNADEVKRLYTPITTQTMVSDPNAPQQPYIDSIECEQPYHVACLKAGRGLREGVSYEQISVPGPLGTRRLATRKELDSWPQ